MWEHPVAMRQDDAILRDAARLLEKSSGDLADLRRELLALVLRARDLLRPEHGMHPPLESLVAMLGDPSLVDEIALASVIASRSLPLPGRPGEFEIHRGDPRERETVK